MTKIQERYRPQPLGVNAALKLAASVDIAGFVAATTGFITVIDSFGTTVVPTTPVTAGVYLPLPFMLSGGGGTSVVTLSGGASGTLGIG